MRFCPPAPCHAFLAAVALAAVSSCGAGASTRATSARVSIRPWRPGPNETRCDDLQSAAEPGQGAGGTRALCSEGQPRACVALVEQSHPLAKSDFELARRLLGRRCSAARSSEQQRPADPEAARATTCSCGAYGTVLTFDRSTEVDGLALLDDACTRGWLDACDQAALIAELCVFERRAMCSDLALQGRLHEPNDDGYARPAQLPSDLRGCWTEPGGRIVCFENDRISVKALDGSWDQVAVSWRGYDGVGVYWPSHERIRLKHDGGAVVYGAFRLARAPADAGRQAAALPSAKDVCQRAKRCLDALRPRPPPAPRSDTEGEVQAETPVQSVADVLGFPTSLVACERIEREARAAGSSCAPR